MASEPTIKHYTAADIEKYHQGLLSPAERHAMEKAALEDPFLADAMEGYTTDGVNLQADLADLKQRLEEKTSKARVIPIGGGGSSFRWLRAAAVVAFVAGAGILVYKLGFNDRKGDMAEVRTDKKTAPLPLVSDTSAGVTITLKTDTVSDLPNGSMKLPSKENRNGIATGNNKQGPVSPGTLPVSDKPDKPGGEPVVTGTSGGNGTNPPVAQVTEAVDEKVKDSRIASAERKEVAAAIPKKQVDNNQDGQRSRIAGAIEEPGARGYVNNQPSNANNARRAMNQANNNNQAYNVFRGRVTDQQNTGVPFARVYNALDSDAGTYTDASGNFNLTYPDSTLTVEVKALGFENTNVQLNTRSVSNQVVMQDDRSLSEVVISNRKPNAMARSRAENQSVEEPEPADGWEKYDSYLANNLQLPDEYLKKQTGGEVQVSFEVDRNGEPIAIRIEKSLCKSCDQEAIRLIKEGPKWRRKARHGRTTVTITF